MSRDRGCPLMQPLPAYAGDAGRQLANARGHAAPVAGRALARLSRVVAVALRFQNVEPILQCEDVTPRWRRREIAVDLGERIDKIEPDLAVLMASLAPGRQVHADR